MSFFRHSSHCFIWDRVSLSLNLKYTHFSRLAGQRGPRGPPISSCLHLPAPKALGLIIGACYLIQLFMPTLRGSKLKFLACLHGKRFGDWPPYPQSLFPVFLLQMIYLWSSHSCFFSQLENPSDAHLTCHLVKDVGNTRQSACRKPARFSWEDQTRVHVKMKIPSPKILVMRAIQQKQLIMWHHQTGKTCTFSDSDPTQKWAAEWLTGLAGN